MKTTTIQSRFAFTLIELLVVISIIGILAAMLMPAIGRAKTVMKIKVAKLEMASLTAAINQYFSEYNRMPGSKMAVASLNKSCPDFTFGTVLPDGQLMSTNLARVISTGNSGYQNANSEVISILCALDAYPNTNYACNPRKICFLNAKSGVSSGGIGPDNIFRDPWGNPYVITLDMNYDEKCQDGFYYPLTKKKSEGWILNTRSMIWSFGPDGKITSDKSVGPKSGENKDNILSWE